MHKLQQRVKNPVQPASNPAPRSQLPPNPPQTPLHNPDKQLKRVHGQLLQTRLHKHFPQNLVPAPQSLQILLNLHLDAVFSEPTHPQHEY